MQTVLDQAADGCLVASEIDVDAVGAPVEQVSQCLGISNDFLVDQDTADFDQRSSFEVIAKTAVKRTKARQEEAAKEEEEECREELCPVRSHDTFLPMHETEQDDIAEPPGIGDGRSLSVDEPCEEPAQLSKHARKRAKKKSQQKAAANDTAKTETQQQNSHSQCCDVNEESASQAELSQKQSQVLAQLAVRLNEQHIAMHLRACSARRLLLATPVNPITRNCDEILEVEPGDVIHCEMTDSSGWGFGTIVAPLRLSGKRGCFKCDFMSPIIVEVRSSRDGDTLEFAEGKWAEAAISQNGDTKNRLREKAALNRIRIAQRAWDKKYGK